MWTIPDSNPVGRPFIIVLIFFLVLAALSFGLRVYSRRLHPGALDASDYTCLLGLVLDIGLVVLVWAAFSHGWGEDIAAYGLHDARFAVRIFIGIDIVWNAAAVSVRISMILFYIRIFVVRRFRMICWAVATLNLVALISVILALCLICQPIQYSFDKTIPNGHCGDIVSFHLFTTTWNLISDSIIVILPMPMLWGLQMRRSKKIGLSIVLGMGVFICALTLARVVASVYYEKNDYTKSGALAAFIAGLEPTIGVINACLPFMPLVLKRVGQMYTFKRAFAALRSVNTRSNEGFSAAVGRVYPRSNRFAKRKGLSDVEMSPFKCGGLATSYVSTGSRSGVHESDPWDEDRNMQGLVFVRKDFSVQVESH